jgi:phosphatidylglycerol lysyltransferase
LPGAIVYTEIGNVRLVPGDPLTDSEYAGEMAKRFVAAAKRQRKIAAFVPATSRFASDAVGLGLTAIKIGSAPYFNLRTWSPRGDRAKKMRAALNQARRVGISIRTVESIDDEFRHETALLCQRWLKTRRSGTAFGWLLALDPFRYADRKMYFEARNENGSLVGILVASPIPVRNGWYLEDVLRQPDAPKGTADLLVVEALKRLAETGASIATLGTCPLANDGPDEVPMGDHRLIERALRVAASRLNPIYNFEGLRRFKSKFVPSWWESEYVLLPRGVLIPTPVARALIKAIVPGGVPELLTHRVVLTLKGKH